MKNILFSLLLLLSASANADLVALSSVWVIDGDTVTAKLNGEKIKIRLANIDAPEKNQPYGKTSKWALINMVKKRAITADFSKKDRYGRWIGTLYANGDNLNHAMVRGGHSWVYPRYNADPALPDIQEKAEREGRGLWKDTATAPWEWRRAH